MMVFEALRSIIRPFSILLITIALCFLSWVFIFGVLIMTLDVLARLREWRWWCDCGWYHGHGAFLLRKSWCGRGVAISIWPQAKGYYWNMGYRWWHILPDGAPGVFLRLQFWKTVIGA